MDKKNKIKKKSSNFLIGIIKIIWHFIISLKEIMGLVLVVLVLLFFTTGISFNDIKSFSRDMNVEDLEVSENLTFFVEEKFQFEEYNRTKLREEFYLQINKLRKNNNKEKIKVIENLEDKAEYCVERFDESCSIESYQNGIGWKIPWHKEVCIKKKGFNNCDMNGNTDCFGNKENVLCLIETVSNDENSKTRIFEDLLERENIGLGLSYEEKTKEVMYWILLQ